MKARPLLWFIGIAFAVFILMLAIQDIVLHLRIHYPMTRMDFYLRDVAERPTLWTSFRGAIIGDVAIFLHSALMIFFWLAISALLWALFVTRSGPGPEK
jgi:hypothetical protein